MKAKPYTPIEAILSVGNLYLPNGRKNAYRAAFAEGVAGNIRDTTFDPSIGARGGHRCCGSKVWWRHKVSCKNAAKNGPDDLSDLKDIS